MSHTTPPRKPAPRALRWLGGAVAVLLCLVVFGLYTVPEFMVLLADQMWACF
ncbi:MULTISPECIES: hypothetical protein [unclassified Acidovorax]|uniref:hypothetical protein n=1 Tax=unclassified Acidovorax TaxID=2684926 RepID=UPI000C582265|nr:MULTISPECIES: hypothetical protein [unclassified Acidovorax]MCT6718461.1 hypothetical protein [Acidovorax sp. K2F]PIF17166.1 hypothetical protein CLU87_1080 [Acidovorax sp. 59]PKW03809.1 hypothetical protein CLU89_3481 [Acidovorax sp. 30]